MAQSKMSRSAEVATTVLALRTSPILLPQPTQHGLTAPGSPCTIFSPPSSHPAFFPGPGSSLRLCKSLSKQNILPKDSNMIFLLRPPGHSFPITSQEASLTTRSVGTSPSPAEAQAFLADGAQGVSASLPQLPPEGHLSCHIRPQAEIFSSCSQLHLLHPEQVPSTSRSRRGERRGGRESTKEGNLRVGKGNLRVYRSTLDWPKSSFGFARTFRET